MRDLLAFGSLAGAAVLKGSVLAVAPQEIDLVTKLLGDLSTTTICVVGLYICSKRMFKIQDELSEALRQGSKILGERVIALEAAVKNLIGENQDYREENKLLRQQANQDRHRILELVEEAVKGGRKEKGEA